MALENLNERRILALEDGEAEALSGAIAGYCAEERESLDTHGLNLADHILSELEFNGLRPALTREDADFSSAVVQEIITNREPLPREETPLRDSRHVVLEKLKQLFT